LTGSQAFGGGLTTAGAQGAGSGVTTCTGAQALTRSHAPIPACAALLSAMVSGIARPTNNATLTTILFRFIANLLCTMKHSMEQTLGHAANDACP
jgi:hypothetical protein